jgi:hypothetical protein
MDKREISVIYMFLKELQAFKQKKRGRNFTFVHFWQDPDSSIMTVKKMRIKMLLFVATWITIFYLCGKKRYPILNRQITVFSPKSTCWVYRWKKQCWKLFERNKKFCRKIKETEEERNKKSESLVLD